MVIEKFQFKFVFSDKLFYKCFNAFHYEILNRRFKEVFPEYEVKLILSSFSNPSFILYLEGKDFNILSYSIKISPKDIITIKGKNLKHITLIKKVFKDINSLKTQLDFLNLISN